MVLVVFFLGVAEFVDHWFVRVLVWFLLVCFDAVNEALIIEYGGSGALGSCPCRLVRCVVEMAL
jgi:hypothetical protein